MYFLIAATNFISFKYKINIIKGLIDRSYKICSSYQKIHEEFQKVTTLLLSNGCPRGIIDRHIKTYLNRKHKPLNENASEIRKSKFAIFCLPFIGEASQQIEKEIKYFLENKIKANFSLRMNHNYQQLETYSEIRTNRLYYISLGQCINFNARVEKPILDWKNMTRLHLEKAMLQIIYGKIQTTQSTFTIH